MKYFNIASVISKSAITPSFSGRMATILPGVRPTILLASSPTANTLPVLRSIATTDGSFNTIPLPLTWINTLAVPRSIPISRANIPVFPPRYSKSGYTRILLHLISDFIINLTET